MKVATVKTIRARIAKKLDAAVPWRGRMVSVRVRNAAWKKLERRVK